MAKSVEEVPNWATLIRDLRKRAGLSQQGLADRVDTTQSNVAKWERAEYKPAPAMWMALSRVFSKEPETFALMELGGVSKDFLMGKSNSSLVQDAKPLSQTAKGLKQGLEIDELRNLRSIPLLTDAAAAGAPRSINEKDVERYITLPADWFKLSSELYALRVMGDSMKPILLDGHIVILDVSQREPKKLINEMVAAIDDGVTVKWLREDDGELLLVPNHVSVRHPVRLLFHKKRHTQIAGKVVRWLGEAPATMKGRK